MRPERWLYTIPLRFRSLFRRAQTDHDLDDEIAYHLEARTEENISKGMPPDKARRAARMELGGVEQVKERLRVQRTGAWLETTIQDIRHGFRVLLKNWKASSIASLSLAVAMGISVAGLSIFDGIMLRPPTASNPDRLLTIYTASHQNPSDAVSYPDYEYYRDHNHSFSDIAALPNEIAFVPITYGNWLGAVTVERASVNYFSVMGISSFLGRVFREGDQRAPVAILTYSCWRRWGSNQRIIGQTLELNHQPFTVIGVAPKNFTGVVFGFAADVILPAVPDADRTARHLFLIGREKDGVTLSQARADLRLLSGQLASAYPQADKDRTVILTHTTALPPDARSTAELISAVLIAMVLMILLIACANVANLLLGLATGRKQEMLIRSALGATRGRLIRQLLTESAILCSAGGLIGFLLTSFALSRFARFSAVMPILGTFNFAADLRPNGTVLAMTLGLILLATLAAGLTPAVYASATNVAGALSGEIVIGGTRKSVIRNVLVSVQVAVCTLVIVAVGLCLQSLRNLQDTHLGFSSRHVVSVIVDLQAAGFSEAKGRELYGEIKRSAAQLTGVQSSSLGSEFPLIDSQWPTDEVRIAGHRGEEIPVNVVDGDYFRTLGIPLIAGRTFDSSDVAKAPEVVVINHDMANTYWPGVSPIGKQMYVGKRVVTVVGVVADSKYNTLDEPAHAVMYYDLRQHYLPQLLLMVRTPADPRLWLQPVADLVRGLGITAGVPPFTSDDAVRFALLVPTIMLRVADILGALAVLLAVLGLYGSVFYSVNERRREIGIRVALGAQKRHLTWLFLRQIALIAGPGTFAGLLLGIGGTILFRSEFYRINPVETQVLIPVGLAMVLLSLGVAYAAARPWINVSPMVILRHK